jgi:superoxide reductase
MKNLGSFYQSGDWKGEKHVPVINAPDKVKRGDFIEVNVNIGEEIAHPNTFEHYISWIKVYFHPEGGNFPIEIGTYDFAAHGEHDAFTEPYVTLKFKAEKSGIILASSYCNIHGLWENSKEIIVED